MALNVIPTYKDIFDGDLPSLGELLDGLPSSLCLESAAHINAALILGSKKADIQSNLIQHLVAQSDEAIKEDIFQKLKPFVDSLGEHFAVITPRSILTIIQYLICNFNNLERRDLSAEEELNYFKAILVCSENYFSEIEVKTVIKSGEISNEDHESLFQHQVWTVSLSQIENSLTVEPDYLLIKGILLAQFLTRDAETAPYVESYLKVTKIEKLENYVFNLLRLFEIGKLSDEVQFIKHPCRVYPDENSKFFLEKLEIDINEFVGNERSKIDFNGLRNKPLYKLNSNEYLVLNWNFVKNKLYYGLLFDFYEKSGIKSNKKFKSIPDFFSHVAGNFTERTVFQIFLEKVLNKKHSLLSFDKGNNQAYPDAYLRIGNKIFIFELKDSFVNSNIIHSSNIVDFKADIERTFINDGKKKKGIQQLLEHIKVINNGNFDFDDYSSRKVKKSNLEIYPIIVYTHPLYALAGVNSYLNNKFKPLLDAYSTEQRLQVKKVNDVVMINLDTFHGMLICNLKVDLGAMCERYYTRNRNNYKRFLKNKEDIYNLWGLYCNFEVANSELISGIFRNQEGIKKLVEIVKDSFS